jgi:lysozyme
MISPDMRLKLKQLLIQHEGMELNLYTDTTGNATIGVGHNLSANGISQTIALAILDEDILYTYNKLFSLDWFQQLNEPRQIAITDMAFNLGVKGLLEFHNMLSSLEKHDYETASSAMLESLWSKQVGERAICLANIIRTGEL